VPASTADQCGSGWRKPGTEPRRSPASSTVQSSGVRLTSAHHRVDLAIRGWGLSATICFVRASECVHVAVDDYSRVAYVEILDNERGVSAVGFLERMCAWFADRGITVPRSSPTTGLLHRPRLRHRVQNPESQTSPHPAPAGHAPTAKPNASSKPCSANGLRRRLPHQQPTRAGTPRLARLLQPATTPRRPQPPSTRHAATHRLTNLPGIYN